MHTPKWVSQLLEQISWWLFFIYLSTHAAYEELFQMHLWIFFLAIAFLTITTDFKHHYCFGCWCVARAVSSISQSWSNRVPRIELATRGKTGQMLWFINCTKLSLSFVSKAPSLVKLWALFHRQNPHNWDSKVTEGFLWDWAQKNVSGTHS